MLEFQMQPQLKRSSNDLKRFSTSDVEFHKLESFFLKNVFESAESNLGVVSGTYTEIRHLSACNSQSAAISDAEVA